MSILTINAGSSSLRLTLFAATDDGLLLVAQAHHQDVAAHDPSLLADFINSIDEHEITLLVHRVVHGGTHFTQPCLIDARVEAGIEQLSVLAPLHNPPALAWIRSARDLLGEQMPQVAVFDSAFYRSLPPVAQSYALPQALCRQYHIRRYGFHGIAHRAMLNRWQAIRPNIKNGGRVISIQLGSGCSITAIDRGVPVDTSMGFSPLEGLVMATRSGDIDPTVVSYLQQQSGLSLDEIERLLNRESGLLGVSGESADMRVLLASDSPEAALAVELYCYRVRKYIGAYLAILGGADAILFGGGVGENSPQVRAKVLQSMVWLGIELDADKNETSLAVEAMISKEKSDIEVWVIPVDEARVMAEQALEAEALASKNLPAKASTSQTLIS
ncbi:Acetate kinase [hydrothermal vent metagenome]|uniref:Acetate kinase n=1 Tax=hydrothermal vent metagenome TaxID=652676 RepID=A0A3B0Z714_9ZZZZ